MPQVHNLTHVPVHSALSSFDLEAANDKGIRPKNAAKVFRDVQR